MKHSVCKSLNQNIHLGITNTHLSDHIQDTILPDSKSLKPNKLKQSESISKGTLSENQVYEFKIKLHNTDWQNIFHLAGMSL